ncbi:hypothetical protein C8R46DRAFT_1216977 [Mycena filopes]|nr:hypothetical protein C8R46DRAFT_1216977 [Mycena filopes]
MFQTLALEKPPGWQLVEPTLQIDDKYYVRRSTAADSYYVMRVDPKHSNAAAHREAAMNPDHMDPITANIHLKQDSEVLIQSEQFTELVLKPVDSERSKWLWACDTHQRSGGDWGRLEVHFIIDGSTIVRDKNRPIAKTFPRIPTSNGYKIPGGSVRCDTERQRDMLAVVLFGADMIRPQNEPPEFAQLTCGGVKSGVSSFTFTLRPETEGPQSPSPLRGRVERSFDDRGLFHIQMNDMRATVKRVDNGACYTTVDCEEPCFFLNQGPARGYDYPVYTDQDSFLGGAIEMFHDPATELGWLIYWQPDDPKSVATLVATVNGRISTKRNLRTLLGELNGQLAGPEDTNQFNHVVRIFAALCLGENFLEALTDGAGKAHIYGFPIFWEVKDRKLIIGDKQYQPSEPTLLPEEPVTIVNEYGSSIAVLTQPEIRDGEMVFSILSPDSHGASQIGTIKKDLGTKGTLRWQSTNPALTLIVNFDEVAITVTDDKGIIARVVKRDFKQDGGVGAHILDNDSPGLNILAYVLLAVQIFPDMEYKPSTQTDRLSAALQWRSGGPAGEFTFGVWTHLLPEQKAKEKRIIAGTGGKMSTEIGFPKDSKGLHIDGKPVSCKISSSQDEEWVTYSWGKIRFFRDPTTSARFLVYHDDDLVAHVEGKEAPDRHQKSFGQYLPKVYIDRDLPDAELRFHLPEAELQFQIIVAMFAALCIGRQGVLETLTA